VDRTGLTLDGSGDESRVTGLPFGDSFLAGFALGSGVDSRSLGSGVDSLFDCLGLGSVFFFGDDDDIVEISFDFGDGLIEAALSGGLPVAYLA